MEKIKDFTDLRIWQQAHKLMLEIYKLGAKLPREEKFNLIDQLKRASLSVPTNIAEAFGRFHFTDSNHFLLNARGSAYEVRSLLMAVRDIQGKNIINFDSLDHDYQELIKGINALIKSRKGSNG